MHDDMMIYINKIMDIDRWLLIEIIHRSRAGA